MACLALYQRIEQSARAYLFRNVVDHASRYSAMALTVVDDVSEIVDFGVFDWLLLHEVMWHSLDVQLVKFVPVADHVLDEWEVLSDEFALDIRVVLPDIHALVSHTTADIYKHDTSILAIRLRKLEVGHGYLAIPDTSLPHSLRSHECLSGLSIFGVVLSPLEYRHIGIVREVERRLLCWILVFGLRQKLRYGIVRWSHGQRTVPKLVSGCDCFAMLRLTD